MVRARFDDLGTDPVGLELTGPHAVLVAKRPAELPGLLAQVEAATAAGSWAAGYLSYEAAPGFDPVLAVRAATPGEPFADLPVAWFALFRGARAAPALAPPPQGGHSRSYRVRTWQPDWDRADYLRRVAAVRAYIAAGETYQCNLTMALRSRVSGSLPALYRDLALAQRAKHCGFLDTGRYVVASASPELFLDWSGPLLTTRPMKGTAARGRWAAEDAARADQLRRSAKEQAENVMITDLLRNDVGKVARCGTVAVPALGELERYESVWQLTSTVTGLALPGVGLAELFGALFPSGSVTGAPKVRTMALIAQLETARRGVYCGALGVVAPAGGPWRARFAVAIRTVVVDRQTGEAVYGTGGGITWDSDPDAEYAELAAKAAILTGPADWAADFQLVETAAFRPGTGLRNRDRHLARLAASAAYFGFRCDLVRVRAALRAALVGRAEPARVRLLLDRSGEPTVALGPLPPPPRSPVRLVLDHEPVRSTDRWLYHKTTRRGAHEARAARHPEADEVLAHNESGQLTESTIANLAVRLAGRWWTPPVTAGCLPGVERERLVERGRLVERALTVADLAAAEDLALVSSLRGWRRAVLVGSGARRSSSGPAPPQGSSHLPCPNG
ncbi:MAG: chorismate-binding protein [Mycobacteriales bacterium]